MDENWTARSLVWMATLAMVDGLSLDLPIILMARDVEDLARQMVEPESGLTAAGLEAIIASLQSRLQEMS